MWCRSFTWCLSSVGMGRVRWQWGQVPMSSPPSRTLSEKDAAVWLLPGAGWVSWMEKRDAVLLVFACVAFSRSSNGFDGWHLSWFETHRWWLSSEDFWKPQAKKKNLPLQTRSQTFELCSYFSAVFQTYLVFLSTLSRNWCLASVTPHSGFCCREQGITWKKITCLELEPEPFRLHPLTSVWWWVAVCLRRSWGCWTGRPVHWLVPKGHIASAVPAELGAAPTDVLMLAQLLPRQQQLTEQTGLQTLGTMVRLGETLR